MKKDNVLSAAVTPCADEQGAGVILDFGTKHIGLVSMVLEFQSEAPDMDEWPFSFGPFPDFTVASGRFNAVSSGKWLYLKSPMPIALRALRLNAPASWGRAGVGWNVAGVHFECTERKTELRGSFLCSDPMLNRIWSVGANTIRQCMLPNQYTYSYRGVLPRSRVDFINQWRGEGDNCVLVDGCRRDREVWVGDLLPEVRTCLYAFYDTEVVRNSLQIFSDQQQENGFLYASSVSAQDFLEYCCWFIVCLWEYYLCTGDRPFLLRQAEVLEKLLGYIASKRSPNSLITLNRMQTWAWTLSRCGDVTSSNCVQVKAMACGANCLRALGKPTEARQLDELAVKISEQLRRLAFDDVRGAFRDVADGSYPYYSLDANALAVLYGVADARQRESALQFVATKLHSPFGSKNIYPPEPSDGRNWPHNNEIWPFAVGFELDARFEANDDAGAFDLIKRCWGNMVDRGARSYWEIVDSKTGDFMRRPIFENDMPELDRWNSYCHGWSAGVTYSMSAYIAGIRPLEPGFSIFSFDPHPCGLSFVHARIPTGEAEIEVEYEVREQGIEAFLTVPKGTTAHVGNQILHDGKHRIYI